MRDLMLLTALNVSLAAVAVLAIVCFVAALRVATTRHTAREHTVDEVSCDAPREVCIDGKCNTSVKCTVTGDFGQLSRGYRPGNEPSPRDTVTVFTTPDGHATLTPFAETFFGYLALIIGTSVLILVFMVLAVVRLIAGARMSRRRRADPARSGD